jgi:hypothetical protein
LAHQVKAARAALAKRMGRTTAPNALTVKDAFEEWFAEQIEPRYRSGGRCDGLSFPGHST